MEQAHEHGNVVQRAVLPGDPKQPSKAVLAGLAPVLVSLEITDKWGTAPSGRIRALSPNESPCGWHSVLLVGYDDGKSEFTFQNCWGTAWGDQGFGYISYERFEASWCEGWLYDLTWSHMPLKPTTGLKGRAWGIAEHGDRKSTRLNS